MSLNDRLAAFFKAHPHEWLDGRTLSEVAGCYAWRSRVSDCRRDYGMTITNQTRKVGRWTISEYRYEPPTAEAMRVMYNQCAEGTPPPAENVVTTDAKIQAGMGIQGHDLNVPWSLR